MTQHKHQISQAYYFTPKHDLRVSGINSDYLKVITPNKIRLNGQLLRILFNVFSNRENNKHDSSCNEDTHVKQHLGRNDAENKTMRDLENCANAAREIGACGQTKSTNRKDET